VGWRNRPLPGLTDREITERLCLASKPIVDDVYAIAARQLDAEDKRETNLNAKAVSLLAASGVSVSVLFALGAALAQHPELLDALGGARSTVMVVAYGVALICGVAAGLVAVWSLKVSADAVVAESDVFGDELRASDDEGGEKGAARYRRFLAAHLWIIYRGNRTRHDAKASKVLVGQYFFAAFLVCLLAIGVTMTTFLFNPRQPDPTDATGEQQKPAPAPTSPTPTTSQGPQKPLPTAVPSTGQVVQGSINAERQPIPTKPPRRR
jgi:hypothetical protein